MNIAVIGGGASGLMAAISAARCGAYVTIYERCDRVGRKILATGNGRCNYTNINAGEENYHGNGKSLIKSIKNSFWVSQTIEFFRELGMLTKVMENSKAFPYSLQASAVLDVLRFEVLRLGIEVVTGFEVKAIQKRNDKFTITSFDGKIRTADKVILSTGGKASPSLGSNGSGYDILKALGHSVNDCFPSLVQVKTDTKYVKALKGIKLDARVQVIGKEILTESYGEVLFTEYGLSGPAIFNISRVCAEKKDVKIVLDLLSEISFYELEELLKSRKSDTRILENYFVGMLNKKLGIEILKYADVLPLSRSSDTLSDKEIKRIAKAVKEFTLNCKGTLSWNNAQVTAGGISATEVDDKTLQSKIVDGLYITGEVLDIDGDCGGYNLQWAWSSGYVAGKSAGLG